MSTEVQTGTNNSSREQADAIQISQVLRPNAEEEAFYKELTLGIEDSLQAHPMIKDVKMTMRPPVPVSVLRAWERRNLTKLPSDLKDYYGSTNGFKLTWNLDYAGDLLKIGEICVNSINQLNEFEMGLSESGGPTPVFASGEKNWGIPSGPGSSGTPGNKSGDAYLRISLEELQKTVDSAKKTSKRSRGNNLTLGAKGKAFLLDSSHPELGTTCLVYPNGLTGIGSQVAKLQKQKSTGTDLPQPNSNSNSNPDPPKHSEPDVQIWFMDPSYQWHFLAPTFSHYYRMLLYHQGMPQWQYRFTPFGISAWAEQMFWLVTPHLLQPEKLSGIPPTKMDNSIWSQDVPPEAALPNSTKNVINSSIFRKKKKDKKPG